jgi:pimeloyl-ACP methyl ester carboxylesterase
MELRNIKIDDGEFGFINADLRYLDDAEKKPVIIFIHGFKSFKDWGFIPQVCKEFATSGAISLNFDFPENGIINPEKLKYDPEVFRTQTLSKMMEDTAVVEAFVRKEMSKLTKDQFNGKVYLVGHSLGAAVAVLAAAKYNLKAEKIIMWNSIAKLDRNTQRQKNEWVKNEYIDIKIQGTDIVLPLDVTYLTDKEIHGDLAIIEAIEKIQQKILIVHGKEDLTSKLEEGELLKKHAGDKAEYFVIDNTGHTFGADHPFQHVTPSLAEAIEKTISFVKL